MFNQWIDCAQSWLYPNRCILCGARGDDGLDLCAACRVELPYNHTACPRCGLPLPGDLPTLMCGHCLRHPPRYARTLTLCRYSNPADHLIKQLKFQGKLAHARLLGELLAAQLATRIEQPPQRIIPVPLHRTRLRERGFNQSVELARPIAARFGIPIDVTSCVRVRATPAQSTLPAAERKANVRNAFKVRRSIPVRHVAILDDVITTGHTVNELAQALRRAGVPVVEVWAVARVAPD
jgi:ComF family protein